MLGILYETPYAQNKATEETCTCSAAQVTTHKLPRNQYETRMTQSGHYVAEPLQSMVSLLIIRPDVL